MPPKVVSIKTDELPERVLAYVPHRGPYQNNPDLFKDLYAQLMSWAEPRGMLAQPGMEMITVYHDDPDTTPEAEQRISVGITVPDDATPGEGIQLMDLPGGTYVVGTFELDVDQYEAAWKAVFDYISSNQLSPGDGPMYESYRNNPDEHPQGKHLVDICIAIV